MTATIVALSVAFVATHLLLSHPPLRTPLVARLGATPFAVAYSALSLAVYGPLAVLWWTERHTGPVLWASRAPLAVHGAEIVIGAGVAFVVAALALPSPALTAMRDVRASYPVRGLGHVTRHPLMTGIGLVTAGHLLVNGWVSDVAFLGSHVVLAIVGAVHQDARLKASNPGYVAYAAESPGWPNPLGLLRVGGRAWVALAAGGGLAVALRYAHRWF